MMRASFLAACSLVLFLAARSSVIVIGAQSNQSTQRTQAHTTEGEAAVRGRYLVEEVAKCSECHTPRDAENQLDHARWLQGAAIWIEPVRHVSNWAQFAPPLAGLPGLSDEQMERVLERGESASGREIQPPMHVYHLNHADAQAVIAYLRSLPTATSR